MIHKVTIKRFKKLDIEELQLPSQVVLAGPNNTGKTTVLQAIAAWSLALRRWLAHNDFGKHKGGYAKVPIARSQFYAVPLRNFDLLFRNREYKVPIQIEVRSQAGWRVAMEIIPDSVEQVYVRPLSTSTVEDIKAATPDVVFVPPMSGLSTEEPVYQAPMLEHLLGQGRPGDMLRNVLAQAYNRPEAWEALSTSIAKLFNYTLIPPDATGALILAEYQQTIGEMNAPRFDIASAGSGFQQVLMLLALLHTRKAAVLLLDEPDAHLHILLQGAIYSELREVAAAQGSQLIIATHSEVVINSVDPRELCVFVGSKPRMLTDLAERVDLTKALRVLDNVDLMLAETAPGVLYLEGYTDLEVFRAFAKVLKHPAYERLLTRNLFWKPTVLQPTEGADGIQATSHYQLLKLVRGDLPGLRIIDGDAKTRFAETEITGRGLQTLVWKRYEIESYLFNPTSLARFVQRLTGTTDMEHPTQDLLDYLMANLPPAVLEDPLGDHVFLNNVKARTDLLPPALNAAGLHGFPYTRYHEIASMMEPEEIPDEVKEKLDLTMKAFNLSME